MQFGEGSIVSGFKEDTLGVKSSLKFSVDASLTTSGPSLRVVFTSVGSLDDEDPLEPRVILLTRRCHVVSASLSWVLSHIDECVLVRWQFIMGSLNN